MNLNLGRLSQHLLLSALLSDNCLVYYNCTRLPIRFNYRKRRFHPCPCMNMFVRNVPINSNSLSTVPQFPSAPGVRHPTLKSNFRRSRCPVEKAISNGREDQEVVGRVEIPGDQERVQWIKGCRGKARLRSFVKPQGEKFNPKSIFSFMLSPILPWAIILYRASLFRDIFFPTLQVSRSDSPV